MKNETSPQTGKLKKINTSVLQPGDIVLTTTNAIESRTIRIFTGSDISHAMLCVSTSSLMDATGEGVQARNPEKMFYPEQCAIYILRLDTELDSQKISKIIDYVRNITGTPYTKTEAVKAITKTSELGSNLQFCSRLIARAYEAAGLPLVDNPNFCTPEDLKNSPRLRILPNSTAPVTPKEQYLILNGDDATIGMRKVTTKFLDAVREFAPKVKDINEATLLPTLNPSLDNRILKALEDSGYLIYWKVEVEKFPWRYNESRMIELELAIKKSGDSEMAKSLYAYCIETLRGHANGDFKHWYLVKDTLNEIYKRTKLKSIHAQLILYRTLVANHEKRVAIAKMHLQRLGNNN